MNPLDRRRNHPTSKWHNLQGSIGLYEKDAEMVIGILHRSALVGPSLVSTIPSGPILEVECHECHFSLLSSLSLQTPSPGSDRWTIGYLRELYNRCNEEADDRC